MVFLWFDSSNGQDDHKRWESKGAAHESTLSSYTDPCLDRLVGNFDWKIPTSGISGC